MTAESAVTVTTKLLPFFQRIVEVNKGIRPLRTQSCMSLNDTHSPRNQWPRLAGDDQLSVPFELHKSFYFLFYLPDLATLDSC